MYFVWKRERIPGIFTSNSVVIVNDTDVVVVDADGWVDPARDLIGSIREITDRPVRTLVLTHGAPDHVQALHVWREGFPGIEIISHQTTPTSIAEMTVPFLQTQKDRLTQQISEMKKVAKSGHQDSREASRLELVQSYRRSLDEVEWVFPTTTFEHSLTLHRGRREIRLLFFGGGHSRGDIVVHLPAEKILIAGDLIISDRVFPGFYFPIAYRASLRGIAALDFNVLLPGHGPMLRGKSYLQMVRELSDFVADVITDGLAAGKSLEQILTEVDLSRFRARFVAVDPLLGPDFDRRMPRAIANAFRELTTSKSD